MIVIKNFLLIFIFTFLINACVLKAQTNYPWNCLQDNDAGIIGTSLVEVVSIGWDAPLSFCNQNEDPITNVVGWTFSYTINGGIETVVPWDSPTAMNLQLIEGDNVFSVTAVSSNGYKSRKSIAHIIYDSGVGDIISPNPPTLRLVAINPPPTSNTYITIEAEDGAITAPMVATSVSNYYTYVSSPILNSGSVDLQFSVANSGNYVIWALCAAGSSLGNDSYFISYDNNPEETWDFFETEGQYTNFTWDIVGCRCGGLGRNHLCDPWLMNLSSGQHTLSLRGREINAKIDRFLITNDRNFIP